MGAGMATPFTDPFDRTSSANSQYHAQIIAMQRQMYHEQMMRMQQQGYRPSEHASGRGDVIDLDADQWREIEPIKQIENK